MNMDYFPIQERPVTLQCIVESSIKREVPANVMLALLETEGAAANTVKKNKDGSYDFGRWQLNSVHLEDLKPYAPAEFVKYAWLHDGCYATDMAAFLLQRCLRTYKSSDFYTRAACYHSKTPSKNAIYRAKLVPAAQRWANWLSANYQVRIIANE